MFRSWWNELYKRNSKTYYEWIRHHKSQAARIASDAMKEYMKDLEKERNRLEKEMKSNGSRR